MKLCKTIMDTSSVHSFIDYNGNGLKFHTPLVFGVDTVYTSQMEISLLPYKNIFM